MTNDDQVQPSDIRTGITAWIFYLTGDRTGLHETLKPAEKSGRLPAVLLGTFEVLANAYPEARDPESIAALRELVAKMAADDDDGPETPPRRIY